MKSEKRIQKRTEQYENDKFLTLEQPITFQELVSTIKIDSNASPSIVGWLSNFKFEENVKIIS